jgi:uncharacterized phage-associated protein
MSRASSTKHRPAARPLPAKLEAVLARLSEKAGPLTKTQAVKLPYLVDVVAQHALGRPIARGRYETWELGVVAREVYAFMTYSDGDDLLAVENHEFSEGGRQLSVRDRQPTPLTADELEVVDLVAEEFGRLDAGRLGLLTKSLNTHQKPGDWGSNHAPELGEDAYARLASGWLRFFEALPALDLDDPSLLKPVDDPRKHVKRMLRA